MFVSLGLLDLLVSKEQRILNAKKRQDKENRELEAELGLQKSVNKSEELKNQIEAARRNDRRA
jgi:DNA-directed RNA polymerase subunit E'/Rpb7